MKKLYAFIIISITLIIICFLGNFWIRKQILLNKNKLIYTIDVSRNNLDYLMDEILTEDAMLILGSSELSSGDSIAFPNFLYNAGNSNYYTVSVGRGNNQSLFHALNITSLSNNIKNNKVVLIISPQWFTKENTTPVIFSSKFQEPIYREFIQNDKLSYETKKKIAERVESLLSADEAQQKRVKDMNSLYLNGHKNILNYVKYDIYNWFTDFKETYSFYKKMSSLYKTKSYSDSKINADDIDYKNLLSLAENAGKKECTNNEYGIYDEYYDTYIRDDYNNLKNSLEDGSYTDSMEYDDLRLFLDVCKELNIEVLLVSVPVNGYWYDYIGFSKNNREQYYQNIRDISSEYNVKLADFSNKEYEKYFLRDIMHLGWKGWVYIDEAIYQFYKNEF